jgi:hypothetical protein
LRAPLIIAAALLASSPAWADSTIVPDPTLTPGAVRTTDVALICSAGTRELRHWSRERDDFILREYGLPPGPHPQYEIDHLVPLGLGGADDDANLWPEPRRSIEPTWNAEARDRLELRLRELVCGSQLDVRLRRRSPRTGRKRTGNSFTSADDGQWREASAGGCTCGAPTVIPRARSLFGDVSIEGSSTLTHWFAREGRTSRFHG